MVGKSLSRNWLVFCNSQEAKTLKVKRGGKKGKKSSYIYLIWIVFKKYNF